MNYLKIINIFTLICFLVISACQKDVIIDEDIIIDPEPTVLVDGSVSGLILDIQGSPIVGAMVSIGINSTISDENGTFTFKNIPLNEKGSLVTAEKDGYFYNAKFIFPRLNKRSFTKFKMTEKTLTLSFPANDGGVAVTNNNAKVTIPANSIKDENGVLYSGEVNVYATWIDPVGENLLYEMPGDLRGQNMGSEQVQLVSYGMIGVELEDINGAPLNILDGKMATIELPVPSELSGSAPATIPLWHFNETTGIWEEEGEAILQNGSYVGTVGHFSFWNVDEPSEFIRLTGSVIKRKRPIADLLIQVINQGNGTAGTAYTDEDGVFSGFVPANEVLTINILNSCNEVIFTTEVGPFSEDTTIDPITPTDEALSFLFISGILQDCEFNGVSNGYIRVDYNGFFSILPLSETGEFSGTVGTCSASEVTIKGYDFVNFKESQEITFNVVDSVMLDIGILSACDDLSEFFEATIGSLTWFYDQESILDFIIDSTGYFELFAGYNDPSTIGLFTNLIRINDVFETNTPYEPFNFSATTDDFTSFCIEPDIICTGVTVTFESIQNTNPGDIIQGSYTGMAEDRSTGEMREVSGTFRSVKD